MLIDIPHDASVSPEKSFKAMRVFFFCNTIIHKIFNANQILNRNPLLPLKLQTSHSSLCKICFFLGICKISSPGFTCDDYKLSHKNSPPTLQCPFAPNRGYFNNIFCCFRNIFFHLCTPPQPFLCHKTKILIKHERCLLVSFSACGGSSHQPNSLPTHGDPRGAFLCHRTLFPMTQERSSLASFSACGGSSHHPILFQPMAIPAERFYVIG